MKILLVCVNASFMHTSLSLRCLKTFADKHFENRNGKIEIEIKEFTINQPIGDVLREIAFTEADVMLFSTYIWNAEYVCKILPDIKKVLPNCILGAGGPEFSYGAKKYLTKFDCLDFIMFGEGELTFVEFIEEFLKNKNQLNLSEISGIYFRKNGEILYSGDRQLLENLDELPFTYPEILNGNFDADHKIYYYESTRGCPFSCAYCLSSVDKRVRFKSLEKVFAELQIFLDANIKLVKFVDRTYNLKPERYIEIWKYILSHHNKKTMFHFEIEAEFLSDEALEFLKNVPSGVMQFEMGVQSSNKKTLESINRSKNTELLAEKIKKIPRTIHQHLDLIAGLPYENLESFGESYDFVMNLRPDALQLGFLKVLSGTEMANFAEKNGWKWMENPVYETFSTPYLSFKDIAFLKEIEILTDSYWNKGIFSSTFNYVFRKMSSWKFFCEIHSFAKSKNAFSQARTDSFWFEFLNAFFESDFFTDGNFKNLDKILLKNLLRYDFIKLGKKNNFPNWYERRYNKEKHSELLKNDEKLSQTRNGFAITDYEEFDFDVTKSEPENYKGRKSLLIFYGK